MPLYDGIGMIAEKNAVVIDVGSAFTKVGYAGESAPRAIIRSLDISLAANKNGSVVLPVLTPSSSMRRAWMLTARENTVNRCWSLSSGPCLTFDNIC